MATIYEKCRVVDCVAYISDLFIVRSSDAKKNDCMVYKIMESNRTGRVKLWVLKELEF